MTHLGADDDLNHMEIGADDDLDQMEIDAQVGSEQQFGTPASLLMDDDTTDFCPFYRTGICNKGALCSLSHVGDTKLITCQDWLKQSCERGDECEFLHVNVEPVTLEIAECSSSKSYNVTTDVCPYYRAGTCDVGASCSFRRVEDSEPSICDDFIQGFCGKGDECELFHVDLDPMPLEIAECSFSESYKACHDEQCRLRHCESKVKDCQVYQEQGFCLNGQYCHDRHVERPLSKSIITINECWFSENYHACRIEGCPFVHFAEKVKDCQLHDRGFCKNRECCPDRHVTREANPDEPNRALAQPRFELPAEFPAPYLLPEALMNRAQASSIPSEHLRRIVQTVYEKYRCKDVAPAIVENWPPHQDLQLAEVNLVFPNQVGVGDVPADDHAERIAHQDDDGGDNIYDNSIARRDGNAGVMTAPDDYDHQAIQDNWFPAKSPTS